MTTATLKVTLTCHAIHASNFANTAIACRSLAAMCAMPRCHPLDMIADRCILFFSFFPTIEAQAHNADRRSIQDK